MIRTRIKGLVAVVIASAAIGGALAAPASGAPIWGLSVSCEVGGTPVSIDTIGTPGVLHRIISNFRRSCDRGTVDYTITKQ
jgi:hypothetical protein